ncbi:endonuclease III [Candidatus Woesearchaeota archaeon]|nr:endonuclease III [Candidatus Woesearchaeota archaeon]
MDPAEKRISLIIAELKKHYPKPKCQLHFENPFQLLVATILSAQCTDVRVNKVMGGLFKKYKTAADIASADQHVIEQEIRSTGFYRNKAKSIIGAARLIQQKHQGKVPNTMDALLELPGVARKTANVVLGSGFGIAAGIVVDTHVKRVAARLELSEHAEPEKIEQDLMGLVPKKDWIEFGEWIKLHGQNTCKAPTPKCGECKIATLCPSAFKIQ